MFVCVFVYWNVQTEMICNKLGFSLLVEYEQLRIDVWIIVYI